MKNMNIFLGIAVTAFVAAILVTSTFANAAPSWAIATAAAASQQNDNVSKLTVTAAGDVPRKVDLGNDAVAGFGWVDGATLNVLVATIHPAFRDSAQNPSSWHLHAARLGPVDADSFCVQEFFVNPQGGISIQGNTIDVNVRDSVMPFATSDIDVAVGFVINPVPASAQCPAVFGANGLQVDVTAAPVPVTIS